MRLANDDELRTVIAHEIAHNAMGHLEARKKNAALGAIFGAIADVALATQGVNTQGQYTSSFMEAAARAHSQDFEREADYVGMYLMARAGVPLSPSTLESRTRLPPDFLLAQGATPQGGLRGCLRLARSGSTCATSRDSSFAVCSCRSGTGNVSFRPQSSPRRWKDICGFAWIFITKDR